MQLAFNQIVIPSGRQLLLKDIDWQTFETLLEELRDHRAARCSYSYGKLEIMVPLVDHESGKEIIGNLVEIRHYVKFQSALIESICYGGENRISHNVYSFRGT